MKRNLLIQLAILLIGLSPIQNFPLKALETTTVDNQGVVEAFLDGLILPMMKARNVPSGVVSIVKGGKLFLTKGYGFQDIKKSIPVDPTKTLFRPGSISKLFTWVSVMQQVEQGRLDLDADVNSYLKSFQVADTYPGQPMTLRHIMTHTSGFEDGGLGYLSGTISIKEALIRYQPERVNPPGLQTAYSNYATTLAGLIVANVSGLEFRAYVQRNIFDVLGMDNSTFFEPVPDKLLGTVAQPYSYEGVRYVVKPSEIISSFAPAGAMSATATDMAKFALAIMNGGIHAGKRILEEETVAQMLTRNFSQDNRLMGLTLGFFEADRNGHRIVGHGGDTQYFHSDLTIDLNEGIAIFTSFSGVAAGTIRDAIVPTFYDTFYAKELKKITPPVGFAARAEKYVGSYNFWRSNFSTLEKVGKVAGGPSIQLSDRDTLIAPGLAEFVEIDKNLFQSVGDGKIKIAFQESSEGEITGMVINEAPSMSLYKVPFIESAGLHLPLLGFSILVFIHVLVRRIYQRNSFAQKTGRLKKVMQASTFLAATNLSVFLVGAIVLSLAAESFFTEIPVSVKLWLCLPILGLIAGLYHLYCCVVIWRENLGAGLWARIRYSVVTFCGLFIGWFYYYWNILGFQYLA